MPTNPPIRPEITLIKSVVLEISLRPAAPRTNDVQIDASTQPIMNPLNNLKILISLVWQGRLGSQPLRGARATSSYPQKGT